MSDVDMYLICIIKGERQGNNCSSVIHEILRLAGLSRHVRYWTGIIIFFRWLNDLIGKKQQPLTFNGLGSISHPRKLYVCFV